MASSMSRTDVLLGLLCLLVLWSILDQRGVFGRFDLITTEKPWLLWVETYYFSGRQEPGWEIEDTFDSKQQCLARVTFGLRMLAGRAAVQEASPETSGLGGKYQTEVIARKGFVTSKVWDEKKKSWEPAFTNTYRCLPAGTDPRSTTKP
jgi:hypothetical protein